MIQWKTALSLACCSLLTGCGVPMLYSASTVAPETTLAPKVTHIVDEVACELQRASRKQLAGDYVITVFMTLQVDDGIDATPSLSFIHLMSNSRNLTTVGNADVGGARRRTFTITYYLDTAKLRTASDLCASASDKRVLRLDGDLGLADIARDGRGSLDHDQSLLHVPTDSSDKSIPSFGSLVQFVITKQLTALGPTWTLKTFKGPGGQAGVLNGKRVNTDNVIVTFAQQARNTTPHQAAAAAKVSKADADIAAANVERSTARQDREVKARQAQREHALVDGRLRAKGRLTPDQVAAIRRSADDADANLREAGVRLNLADAAMSRAEGDRAAATTDQAAADAEAKAQAPADAVSAGQSLLTTMIFQNLGFQPR